MQTEVNENDGIRSPNGKVSLLSMSFVRSVSEKAVGGEGAITRLERAEM